MAVMNMLGLTLGGPEYRDEFLELALESLRVNRENPECLYIDAFESPTEENHFMVTSLWTSEEALMEWYRSPFHVDLRKRGMQGMLKSYFNYQGPADDAKTHRWERPAARAKQ